MSDIFRDGYAFIGGEWVVWNELLEGTADETMKRLPIVYDEGLIEVTELFMKYGETATEAWRYWTGELVDATDESTNEIGNDLDDLGHKMEDFRDRSRDMFESSTRDVVEWSQYFVDALNEAGMTAQEWAEFYETYGIPKYMPGPEPDEEKEPPGPYTPFPYDEYPEIPEPA